jgi:enediyne biosynthesis protein E4
MLLRNHAGKQNHWLGINLVGTKSNRDAIGARITYQAGDLKRQRMPDDCRGRGKVEVK